MSNFENHRLGDSAAYRAATARPSRPVTPEQAAVLARSAALYPEVPAGIQVAATGLPNGQVLLEDANARAQAAGGPRPRQQEKKKGILSRVMGAAGDVVGAAKDVAGAVLPDQVGQGLNYVKDEALAPIQDTLKPAVRGAAIIAEAPLQTVVGTGRQVYGLGTGQQKWEGWNNFGNEIAAQTTLGQVLNEWDLPGTPGGSGDVDTGSGFFPGGDEVQERQVAERAAGSIGNSAWTPGRWLAQSMDLDQGSVAHQIVSGSADFAVAFLGDPTAKALKVGSKVDRAAHLGTTIVGEAAVARAAKKATPEWRAVIDEALGVIPGSYDQPRTSALVSNAAKWMYGKNGRKMIIDLAEESSFAEVWTKTGMKFPVHLAKQIADSDDPAEVANLLADAMTSSVRSIPTTGRTVDRVIKNRQAQGRLFNMVPDTHISWEDPETAFRNLNNSAANMNLNGQARKDFIDKAADLILTPHATSQDRYKMIGLWADVLDTQLGHYNIPNTVREDMTKFTRELDAVNFYDLDDTGKGIEFVEGAGQAPLMSSQMLNTGFFLYDPQSVRVMREQTANNRIFRFVENNPAYRLPVSFIAGFQSEVWKPAQLIGPKYLIKILGEERLRVYFGGKIEGPLGYMHTLFGSQYGNNALGNEFKTLLQKGTGLKKQADDALEAMKGITDPAELKRLRKLHAEAEDGFRTVEDDIAAEFDTYDHAMNRSHVSAIWDDAGADRAMAQQVKRGNSQPIQRAQDPNRWVTAQADSILTMRADPVYQRLANGGLFDGDSVDGVAREGIDGVRDWLTHGAGQKFVQEMSEVPRYANMSKDEIAEHMVTVGLKNITYRTGNDARLLEGIAKGTVDGHSIGVASRVKGNNASEKLREVLDEAGETNPDISQWGLYHPTNKERMASGAGRDINRFVELRDKMTRVFFQQMYGSASDKLNRSPAFRSFYWRRVEELAPHMSPRAAAKLYDDAAKELPKKQLERLRDALTGKGDLELEDVNKLAGHGALDDTTDLLFDATKRTQMFDVLRIISPFGEAWREIITSYSRLLTQNPQTIRRFQQGVEAARGAGILYTNDYGEEAIAIRGSGALMSIMTGGAVKADLEMGAKSLSLGTSVIPGIGPAVSLPMWKVIPPDPGADWARDVLFPYGKPQGLDLVPLPAWSKKLTEAAGWTDGKTAASTVGATMNLLVIKDFEKYKNDRELLINDAKAVAQGVLVARGLSQLFAPGAPMVRYIAETKDGDVSMAKLSDEFRKIEARTGDYTEALVEFLDTYGEGAAFTLAGATQSRVAGLDATKEFSRFERENGWLFQTDSEIAGYFGPHGTEENPAEFNYSVYVQQLESQYRRPLTVDERIAAGNQIVGNMRVAKAEQELPPKGEWTDFHRAYMRQVKSDLEKELGGYSAYDEYDVNKVKRQIDKVMTAAQDERLVDNDVASAVLEYKAARDEALAMAQASGRVGLDQSKDTAFLRAYLTWTGEKLAEQTPGFATVWDRLLSREVDQEDA